MSSGDELFRAKNMHKWCQMHPFPTMLVYGFTLFNFLHRNVGFEGTGVAVEIARNLLSVTKEKFEVAEYNSALSEKISRGRTILEHTLKVLRRAHLFDDLKVPLHGLAPRTHAVLKVSCSPISVRRGNVTCIHALTLNAASPKI